MPEQGQQFLAGFQLAFASDIHSRLQLKLPNHFPLNSYRIEDIFQAALYTLRSQHSAPSVLSSRDVPPPFSLPSDRSQSIQVVPQVEFTSLAASESSSLIKAAPDCSAQVPAEKQYAPPNATPRDKVISPSPTLVFLLPEQVLPRIREAFPQARAHIQVDSAPKAPKSSCQANASLVHAPRRTSLPPTLAKALILPSPVIPIALSQFQFAQQSVQFAHQGIAALSHSPQSPSHAPFVPLPRGVSPLCSSHSDARPSTLVPPQTVPTFPQTQEHPVSVQQTTPSPVHVHKDQQHAPLSLTSRSNFLPPTPTRASPLRIEPALRTVEAFPLAQSQFQVRPEIKTSKSSCPANTSSAPPLCHDLSSQIPTHTSAHSTSVILAPLSPFPSALQSFPSAHQGTVRSTSTPPSQQSAPSKSLPRRDLSLFPLARTPSPPATKTPAPFPQFLPAQESHLSLQQDMAWFARSSNCQHPAPFVSSPRHNFMQLTVAPATLPPIPIPPHSVGTQCYVWTVRKRTIAYHRGLLYDL